MIRTCANLALCFANVALGCLKGWTFWNAAAAALFAAAAIAGSLAAIEESKWR